MRLFVAVNPPLEIKEKIKRLEADLKKCDLAAKWVKAENIHLTLKFLGEVGAEKIPSIKQAMEKVAGQFKAFEANMDGFGFFPSERNPRVFFVKTNQEEILKDVYRKLEAALKALGFAPEDKFKSHLTLARLKGRKNLNQLKEGLKKISLSESFSVKAITLFKSTLTAEGPVYSEIFKAALTA